MGAISADNLPNLNKLNSSNSSPDNVDIMDLYDSWLESIRYYIDSVCDELRIPDLTTAPQTQFNAVLKTIGRKLFMSNPSLKAVNPDYSVMAKYGNTMNKLYYNPDALKVLLDLYIYLCDCYDKAVSFKGFSCLCGMSYDELYYWLGDNTVSKIYSDFAKTIKQSRHDSLTDILTTAKRNPVGILGILNHEYGWNMPGVTRETKRVVALEADQLPDLGAIKNASLTSEKTATEGYKLPTMPEKAFKQ